MINSADTSALTTNEARRPSPLTNFGRRFKGHTANILLIGSAHFDIVVKYDDRNQETVVDKGSSVVEYSFGGTVLNVASYLQDFGYKPFVMTALDRSSPMGQSVVNAFRAGRLSQKHLLHDPLLQPSAFVGITQTATSNENHTPLGSDKPVHLSYSYMSVSESRIIFERLAKTIRDFRWVVFDTNLSEEMIVNISSQCQSQRKTLVGVTSGDAKTAVIAATVPYALSALCINVREANILASDLLKELDPRPKELSKLLPDLHAALGCKILIVIEDDGGWWSVSHDTVRYEMRPVGEDSAAFIGIKEAACAGLMDALIQMDTAPQIDVITDGTKFVTTKARIGNAIKRSLRIKHASSFAQRTSQEALGEYQRHRTERIGLISILSVLLTVLFGAASFSPAVKDQFTVNNCILAGAAFAITWFIYANLPRRLKDSIRGVWWKLSSIL